MIYFIIIMAGLGVYDILQMKTKKQKEIVVYVIFMLLVGLFGIFYYIDPERTSFSKLLLNNRQEVVIWMLASTDKISTRQAVILLLPLKAQRLYG